MSATAFSPTMKSWFSSLLTEELLLKSAEPVITI
jgi:hypothetical protein